ncbi:hypothetical protein E2C01_096306 [Portunus trituberculatus]|uniref:Uncharacterized protein n=1 Tax=Portunus trituberculatus TaxID=210409 RepID=A0A5B7K1P3_PORTR|nr:hypothetical protein [Portunus trituberculatus]
MKKETKENGIFPGFLFRIVGIHHYSQCLFSWRRKETDSPLTPTSSERCVESKEETNSKNTRTKKGRDTTRPADPLTRAFQDG